MPGSLPRDAISARALTTKRFYPLSFSRLVSVTFSPSRASMDLDLFQLDTDTALLYDPIKEDVYIKHPTEVRDGRPRSATSNTISMVWHFAFSKQTHVTNHMYYA
jgi:hypothetical protein